MRLLRGSPGQEEAAEQERRSSQGRLSSGQGGRLPKDGAPHTRPPTSARLNTGPPSEPPSLAQPGETAPLTDPKGWVSACPGAPGTLPSGRRRRQQGAPAGLRGVAASGRPGGVGSRRRDRAARQGRWAETTERRGPVPPPAHTGTRGAARSPSSAGPPTPHSAAGQGAGALPQKRHGEDEGCGFLPRESSKPRLHSSGTELHGEPEPRRRTRQGKFRPARASGERSRSAPQPRSGPRGRRTCSSRGYSCAAGGAARPIGHERGFLQLPRPRRLSGGATRRSPARRPRGLHPPRTAGLGAGFAGSAGRRRPPGPRSRAPSACARPAPGSPDPLPAARAPPDTGSGRTSRTRRRGCPAVHSLRPASAKVPVGTRRTSAEAAPRRETPVRGSAARPGVPSAADSLPAVASSPARSPGPGWGSPTPEALAPRRWRARRLRQRAACPGAGEPSSEPRPRTRGG